MLKPLIPALMTLSACVSPVSTANFDDVYLGSLSYPSEVSLDGVIDTSGTNFYSLFDFGSPLTGSDCIPLILDRTGQNRAKRLNGRRVVVQGRVIPMDKLNEVIPGQYGEIDGREWSGTRCDGKAAIYVTQLTGVGSQARAGADAHRAGLFRRAR